MHEDGPSGWPAHCKDITDRKRTEARLRLSEERLRMAPDLIGSRHLGLGCDLRPSVLVRRRRTAIRLGARVLSGTYTDYIGLIYLLDRGSTLTRLELSLRDQTSVHIRHRVVWPDSSIHWLAWSGRIYRNADGVATRVLGIVHDTTGRMDE